MADSTMRRAWFVIAFLLSFAASEVWAIVEPVPVDADRLTGLVQVVQPNSGKICSGSVIGSNTILTAKHCLCSGGFPFFGSCRNNVEVTFRDDPRSGTGGFTAPGIASGHPGFGSDLVERQTEHDLAVVTLTEDVAPAWVTPMLVADGFLSTSDYGLIAGLGYTGDDCDGPWGAWNWDYHAIDEYEDGHDIIAFDGRGSCEGDSGGPVMDVDGNWVYGVYSMWDWSSGQDKSTTTGNHFNWIKDHMCKDTPWNRCDGHGHICNCTADTMLLWRETTGQLRIWFMDGGSPSVVTSPGWPGMEWQVAGSGDFNADDHPDILWRHFDGRTAIWLMRDGSKIGERYPGGPDPGRVWSIQAVGDFDGDRYSDILWRDVNGQLAIWGQGDIGQATYPGFHGTPGGPVDPAWKVLGVGDFDGDFRSDIFWRHEDGRTSIWYMAGAVRSSSAPSISMSVENYDIQAIGDFDGNTRDDILWRNKSDGLLTIGFNGGDFNSLSYPTYQNNRPSQIGGIELAWKIQGVGDVNFDGRDDLIWRHSDGRGAIWAIEGERFIYDFPLASPGPGWKVEDVLGQGISSVARPVPEPAGFAGLLLGAALLRKLRGGPMSPGRSKSSADFR